MTAPTKYLPNSAAVDAFPDGPTLPLAYEWMPGGLILDVSAYRRVSVEMFYMNKIPGSVGNVGRGEILPVGSSAVSEPGPVDTSWFPWDWEDELGSSSAEWGSCDPSWNLGGLGVNSREQIIVPKSWLLPECTNYSIGEGIGIAFVRLRKTLDVTDVRWLQFYVREAANSTSPGNLELGVIGAV